MQLKIFFKCFPETANCPSCRKVGTIRRSRAHNLYENAVKFSRVANIYKCRECGWRGVLRKYTINKYSFITFGLYALLIWLVAYIITQVLKKNFSTLNIFPGFLNAIGLQ